MAQIIKHRRGNLEGLSSATTRAGELLVVTGSSGLGTIANGDSLVFVGSAIAHISLGFTYLNIGYTGLIYFGLAVGAYLIFNIKKFVNLNNF